MRVIERFLRFGHHESIAVTLDEDSLPHVAPMGVEYSGSHLILRPYKSSKTYANLVFRPQLSLNFTHDARYFFKAIFKQEEISFDFSDLETPPIIKGDFDLYIKGQAEPLDLVSGRAVFLVKVEKVCEGPGSKLALSRANNALLEALVYYTKIVALINERGKELAEYLSLLRININLVRRLGNPELVEMAKTIENELSKLLGEMPG